MTFNFVFDHVSVFYTLCFAHYILANISFYNSEVLRHEYYFFKKYILQAGTINRNNTFTENIWYLFLMFERVALFIGLLIPAKVLNVQASRFMVFLLFLLYFFVAPSIGLQYLGLIHVSLILEHLFIAFSFYNSGTFRQAFCTLFCCKGDTETLEKILKNYLGNMYSFAAKVGQGVAAAGASKVAWEGLREYKNWEAKKWAEQRWQLEYEALRKAPGGYTPNDLEKMSERVDAYHQRVLENNCVNRAEEGAGEIRRAILNRDYSLKTGNHEVTVKKTLHTSYTIIDEILTASWGMKFEKLILQLSMLTTFEVVIIISGVIGFITVVFLSYTSYKEK